MKKNNTVIPFCCAILIAYLCLPGARAQTPKVEGIPGHAAGFVSTFTDNRNFGKDPFFPKSKRRELQPVQTTPSDIKPGELPVGMVLKGLSGTKEKPLAIINNRTFAAGEEAELRIGLGIYRVRVTEIKENSVMVSVNGTPPRELTFRQGI